VEEAVLPLESEQLQPPHQMIWNLCNKKVNI
jgi:hypothetical protein